MKQVSTVLDNLNIVSCFENDKITRKKSKARIENDLIIQHNDLIEARYKLSLQEKRVVLWLLTQIKPSDEDFKLHKLKITEFAKILNLEVAAQYLELQKITLNLMKKVLKIYEPHTNSIFQVAWQSFARYYSKKGYIELRFDPALKPYLLQLKSHFTQLTLSDIIQLNSIYAMRIYELVKQYEFAGQKEIDVDNLREYCGITRVEYTRYNDFKRKVLERAKKEINQKTDLNINYVEIKESRKIVAIKWTIRKKDLEKQKHSARIDRLEKELRSEAIIVNSFLEYGFSKIIAKRLIKLHGEETIKNAIRAVDLQIEKGKAKNPKAMLMAAFKEKWHPEIFKTKKGTNF